MLTGAPLDCVGVDDGACRLPELLEEPLELLLELLLEEEPVEEPLELVEPVE